jgi:hypothetical protein
MNLDIGYQQIALPKLQCASHVHHHQMPSQKSLDEHSLLHPVLQSHAPHHFVPVAQNTGQWLSLETIFNETSTETGS